MTSRSPLPYDGYPAMPKLRIAPVKHPIYCTADAIEESVDVDQLQLLTESGVVFTRGSAGLIGRGMTMRLELPADGSSMAQRLDRILSALRSIRSAPGATPIAMVSVPFSPTKPILAIIPRYAVRTSGGSKSSTFITVDGSFAGTWNDGRTRLRIPRDAFPTELIETLVPTPASWRRSVLTAVRRIDRQDLDKVVLARKVVLEGDIPFSQVRAVSALRRDHPRSRVFAIDGFVGASPEVLIERKGREIHSLPLAGTLTRSAGSDSLLRSAKDLAEHRYLRDMMHELLAPYCQSLQIPTSPRVISAGSVNHLATPVHGLLRDENISVLDLVARLHPTAAVAGSPTAVALSLINDLESIDRGRYAGAVGWVDANGDGEFAVAIRCAQLDRQVAHLYAGSGIVAGSDPDREYEETLWKLETMLNTLVPSSFSLSSAEQSRRSSAEFRGM